MDFKIKSSLALSVFATTLISCGGGGGDSAPPPTVSFSGGVFKGLLQNALVEVFAVESGQISDTAIATAFTDSAGMYSFDTTVLPSLVFVKTSGRDDEVTLMQCDLSSCGASTAESLDTDGDGQIEFGEWLHVDSAFELTAYFSNWGESDAPTVSLITHIVAEQLTTLTEADLDEAYTEVKEVLGLTVDPQDLPVFDVTTTETLETDKVDSLKVAALLESVDADSGLSFTDRIETLLVDENDQLLPSATNFSVYELTLDTVALVERIDTESEVLVALAEEVEVAATEENKLPDNLRPPSLPPFL